MSVRRSLAWTFSGQIATLFITFSGSLVLARLLSPSEMGVYGVGLATAGLISIVAVGMSSYVIREVQLTEDRRASAFTINAAINAAASGIIFASSHLVARYFHVQNVESVLRLLAIPPLIGIFEFLPNAMSTRNMDFKAISVIQVGGAILNTGMTIFLAVESFSSLSMPYAMIAASLFRVAMFLACLPQYFLLRISFRDWRPALFFGFRMISVSGAGQIVQRLSDIILGAILGLAALGVYARASNLASLLFVNLYGTATAVIFSQLSKSFRESGILRDTFLRGLEMILALMWPLLIGGAILAGPAIRLLYGERWLAAATPLSLLFVAQFIVLTFGMNWELFVLRDKTVQQTKYEMARSIVGLVFFSAGCVFGLGGAAFGRIAEAIVGAVLYLPKMPQMAGTNGRAFLSIYLKSAALTAAAVAPSTLLMFAHHWSPQTPIARVILSVLAGVALWALVLRYLRHPLFSEIKIFISAIS